MQLVGRGEETASLSACSCCHVRAGVHFEYVIVQMGMQAHCFM